MNSYIRKVKTKSGATAVQIEYKVGRKRVCIKHIGSARDEVELEALLVIAGEKRDEGQVSFDFAPDSQPDICLEKSYSSLLWETFEGVYRGLGFEEVSDPVFRQLVLARIIEPVSKLDTIRVLGELGLGTPSNSAIHRCLRRVVDQKYRDTISAACFRHTEPNALTLVLYDVTTLYFEIQNEDEYRKSGLSKERRLEPQITIGLLVDRNGFPLEIRSFEGNKGEVKTIVPVLSDFRKRHKLSNITVTADAAMLSAGNIAELEALGYHYIIGSRIAKTPYGIEEYLAAEGAQFHDGQIFEAIKTVTIDGKRGKRREIFQYRAKRAALDLSNIDKTVAKAQKMVDKKADIKRNRFLKVSGAKREINEALVAEARRKAGIKGYVTDLNIPAQQVIDAYHALFQVEKSFRMSKSDLRARPVFHHKRDSIEAHLTVVFAALAIARHIEWKTSVSIKKFVKLLKPVCPGIISINGVTYPVKPRIPDHIQGMLSDLR
jgi:transposase